METIESLRQRMESARDLESVVKTMKAMAAASIWKYEQAVKSLVRYTRTVELGLQIALRRQENHLQIAGPPRQDRLGALVFGSDQGLVGRFNDRIVDFAIDEMNALTVQQEERQMIAIGRRVAYKLEAANQPVVDAYEMPSSLSGVRPILQDMMVRLETWWVEEQVDRILLFHNRPESGASYEAGSVQLLPVDLEWLQRMQAEEWHSRSLPTFDMAWEDFFADLIQEYFYVTTHRAFAASLAAENASRLASMQAAEQNIEEQLNSLEKQYHQLRQSSITAELLDIVAGSEATKEG
jgi:F-type H+-transporting ATPase subunit gamma